MADLAITSRATTNRRIDPVRKPADADQMTLPAAEAITAGQAVRVDPTTGRWTGANATLAAEADFPWIALATVVAGETVTAYRSGVVDGFVLDALDYGAPVYLSNTDGALGDVAGTVSVVVGRVVPATAVTLGTAYDKLLQITL